MQGSHTSRGKNAHLHPPVSPPTLSPHDATSIASIALFLVQQQHLQPCLFGVLPLYAAVLPTVPPSSTDVVVQLASYLVWAGYHAQSPIGPGSDWLALQLGKHHPQLSGLIISGVDHINPDSSSFLLLALLSQAGVEFVDAESMFDSFHVGFSSSDDSTSVYLRSMVPHLLQACTNSGSACLSGQHLLSTVCTMLYTQIPPSHPHTFLTGLCKAITGLRLMPPQLLLLLPLAATFCRTPLPQDFIQLYDSMLVGRAIQQHQAPPCKRISSPAGASSRASLQQGICQAESDIVGDWLVGPELASLVLRPRLQLQQPVVSPEVLAVATIHWLDSISLLRPSDTDQAAELILQASTILQTAAASPLAPHAILQERLDVLATAALHLAAGIAAGLDASNPQQQCGPDKAALLIALGCYVQHLQSAPAPLLSSQSWQLAKILTQTRESVLLYQKSPNGPLTHNREPEHMWAQSAVEIMTGVVTMMPLPGQAMSFLSTSELIHVSYSMTVQLACLLDTAGLRRIQGLLAGPITTVLVSQGLDSTW